ncbi:phosphate regulon sensor histidine kinase PhoR [Granulosicoccus antarcticus]|uniref:Phosphate regulon sensor protein PhoR n=1 Tax=Granulosicoccus antarcticus IMCC3135 TaxID=1192854 RepID=A0A2Z2P3T5_9GAMM|nr:phosphate regulon sensor histidine kinase PhoR [Granulosicoccus antarcticus]ASJ74484.1 Phosphate regulon sensor protein PhoR [Granulosicoccus antarcticus IMCC3135]
MLSNCLKGEISRFLTGLLGVALAGFVLGFPAICALIYLTGYVFWLLRRMDNMVRWLDSGAKPANAPQTTGLTDEMIQLIHREKKYSRKQRNRYRGMLAQFNSLAADLPDATVVLDRDFEIRWSNSAAQRLLNIDPEKDRGQRIDNLVRLPKFREFLHNNSDEEELEIPSSSIGDRIMAIRKVPTGKHMTVLIAADITQRVQVREMRKAFVGDVSHELRTPLTVIRGYLEMLRENESLDEQMKQGLDQVTAQSDRMRGIVEDLLQLSKMEGNPLAENEGDTLNMGAMIQTMVHTLGESTESHEFILELDSTLALVGSEREIYSACHNLLTNAVRYTDPGSTIRVSWQQSADGEAVYSVADNGHGIEARHLSRLSERFYRVDAGRSRDDGGTGLGLAIVKHAAQRHGGLLSINSTPGSGSVFTITFPPARVLPLQLAANQ